MTVGIVAVGVLHQYVFKWLVWQTKNIINLWKISLLVQSPIWGFNKRKSPLEQWPVINIARGRKKVHTNLVSEQDPEMADNTRAGQMEEKMRNLPISQETLSKTSEQHGAWCFASRNTETVGRDKGMHKGSRWVHRTLSSFSYQLTWQYWRHSDSNNEVGIPTLWWG